MADWQESARVPQPAAGGGLPPLQPPGSLLSRRVPADSPTTLVPAGIPAGTGTVPTIRLIESGDEYIFVQVHLQFRLEFEIVCRKK